jgi:uncharacterized protein (DUF433 family)
MWRILESWQIEQLKRLSTLEPERVETMLNTLWASYPGLYEELAISAVDTDSLGVGACSDRLGRTPEEVEQEVVAFRNRPERMQLMVENDGGVARLSSSRIPVWEVVREYRKLGSVERLTSAFPNLSRPELAAALKFAESHPEEIEDHIARYEDMLVKRRREYPFAR